jgi:hypothetical protein
MSVKNGKKIVFLLSQWKIRSFSCKNDKWRGAMQKDVSYSFAIVLPTDEGNT